MPQPNRPRKGSMGFGPRKRAVREVPRFNTWPEDDGQVGLQGFAGFKAGMTHVVMVDDQANSPTEGMESAVPVTVVEVPPMGAAAVRVYEDTAYGLRPLTEVWAEDLDQDLSRTLSVPDGDQTEHREELTQALEEGRIADVRVLSYTVPRAVPSVPKKKPDVMENRVGGGTVDERVEFALDLIDGDATFEFGDVFRAGEFLDVAGVTKGKGTQGPVKRWGVQKRKGKHARQGWRRRIGNLGPWNPSRVRSTVPQQGQTGYHQRTELNKRLVDFGAEDDVTVAGGFPNYGEVEADYALIKGSVPGPEGRLVRMRPAVRPTESPRLDPEVRFVSTATNQG
ncbi:MAG: 50S ribosomal protein L3 [Halanaeroarchaeum sp.]